jgi:serine/threonine-protein kinase RsbW
VLAELWQKDPTVSDGDRMRLETAAVEIVGNIVEHAYRSDGPATPRRGIDVVVTADPGQVVAVLADDGMPHGLDLSDVTMPGADAESGRGLPLATAVLDELLYERVGDRNRWTLTCRRRD